MKLTGTVTAVILALLPSTTLELGKPVPEIALGRDSLSALTKDGKIVAVYFWSCDCPFGPPNYPNLQAASEKYADNAKVRVFVVSSSGEPEPKGAQWAKESGLKATFVYDEGRKIARHFSPRRVNATFVVDAKGYLVYRGGIADEKSNFLIEAIQATLEGKIPPASDQKFEGCAIKP